jgi:multiple sugar transport system ATP-binding protein
MCEGAIEQIGTPLELYDTPINSFVAGFIGSPSMNMIAGTLEQGQFVSDGVRIDLRGRWAGKNGSLVTLGIRPEDLHLDPNGFEVEIVTIEPTGAETHVVAALGKSEMLGTFRERIANVAGDKIKVGADLSRMHLFDARTTMRLAPV